MKTNGCVDKSCAIKAYADKKTEGSTEAGCAVFFRHPMGMCRSVEIQWHSSICIPDGMHPLIKQF